MLKTLFWGRHNASYFHRILHGWFRVTLQLAGACGFTMAFEGVKL